MQGQIGGGKKAESQKVGGGIEIRGRKKTGSSKLPLSPTSKGGSHGNTSEKKKTDSRHKKLKLPESRQGNREGTRKT